MGDRNRRYHTIPSRYCLTPASSAWNTSIRKREIIPPPPDQKEPRQRSLIDRILSGDE